MFFVNYGNFYERRQVRKVILNEIKQKELEERNKTELERNGKKLEQN